MRPFVALTFILGCAYAAPSNVLGYAGALGYAAAPAHLGYAAAPAHLAYAAAPAVAVAAPAVAVPAPYQTETQAEGFTTVHQPAPIVTKEVHYGQTSYVSGYNTAIHKPATPHLPIQVPTVLKGTQSINAPIVKTQTQIHTVNEPVYVERRVEVPYDVPVLREQIVEVPTAVHVDKPYAVPHPVPVVGETIVRKTVAAPIITHSNHVSAPIAHGYAPAALGYGYAAAPAVNGYATAAAH